MNVCPACGGSFKAQKREGVIRNDCESCERVWLQQDEYEKLIAVTKREFALEDLRKLREECLDREKAHLERVHSGDTVRYLRCPACPNQMRRKAFASVSGIVVDLCPSHGIVVAKHDLDASLEFIARGGELLAQDKKIQELKEQVTDLESKADLLARQAASAAGWSAMHGLYFGFQA